VAQVLTLADFRPSARADDVPWAEVRVEQADFPDSQWALVTMLSIDPVDEDPADPALRSFTAAVTKDWARLVFLDADGGEDKPCAAVYVPGPVFRPTLSEVSALMRARTYSGATPDPKNPMAVLAGGALVGEFDEDTRPTGEEIESELIPAACTDLLSAAGSIPGFLLGEARRTAALKVGAEIERSYIPEQADEGKTIYQTLRITFEEQARALRQRLQWWALAQAWQGEQ
jgi:hypothetical protein